LQQYILVLALCISTIISYAIILLTSYRILKTLRKNVAAQRTKALQKQLTIVMLIQVSLVDTIYFFQMA
uniref:G_PROTEIN_RECEP_F1_2 domain-containing protein n=1 Tax=Gongylonema pulchrum TaxID=637853 RepID=A0A183EVQ0_9BILA